MKKPEIKKFTDWQYNQHLKKEIRKLIEPSYQEAGLYIEQSFNKSNELYTIWSEKSELVAFFMVGFHFIDTQPFYYGGLSACKNDLKNTGILKWLYYEFLRDCIRKEVDLNQRIITYWTTATPIVYYLTNRYWADVQPDLSGKCTEEGLRILRKIAEKKYPHTIPILETPFLLRKAAMQVSYSKEETQRIQQAARDLNLNMFDQHNFNESDGDRFLMFGYTPPHNRFIEITRKMEEKVKTQ